MGKQLPDYLLAKFLKGQCTPDEEASVEHWYNSFQNSSDYLSVISKEERNELKNRIRTRIESDILKATGVRFAKLNTLKYWAYSLSGIAAILIVYFILVRPVKLQQVNGIKQITKINNTRNIIKQVLSDGSRIWMMPGAKIEYAQVFTGDKREITLSGESFFEVTKNPSKPFIVYSGNLITKVWGTSFRIRDAGNLSFADVTVLTGKVSVKLLHPGTRNNHFNFKTPDEVMIYPSEQVVYAKKQHLFKEQSKPEMEDLFMWKKPNLSFDNEPVKDVIPVLNNTFNVHIKTTNQKVNAYLLSADFDGLNFPEIMEMIHKALNIDYEINGKTITITEANNQ